MKFLSIKFENIALLLSVFMFCCPFMSTGNRVFLWKHSSIASFYLIFNTLGRLWKYYLCRQNIFKSICRQSEKLPWPYHQFHPIDSVIFLFLLSVSLLAVTVGNVFVMFISFCKANKLCNVMVLIHLNSFTFIQIINQSSLEKSRLYHFIDI